MQDLSKRIRRDAKKCSDCGKQEEDEDRNNEEKRIQRCSQCKSYACDDCSKTRDGIFLCLDCWIKVTTDVLSREDPWYLQGSLDFNERWLVERSCAPATLPNCWKYTSRKAEELHGK